MTPFSQIPGRLLVLAVVALSLLPSRAAAQSDGGDGGARLEASVALDTAALVVSTEPPGQPIPDAGSVVVTAFPNTAEPEVPQPPLLGDNLMHTVADHEIGDIKDLDLKALLETHVVSATKMPVMEDQAPAMITVISRDEIRRWGYSTIDEMLTHVVGLYVVNDHVIPNVAVRGISGGLRSESGLIKVMIDGRSVAFRWTSGNWLGPELIPLSAIQQVEVIRGPASALYGADALMGVVNIVTRRPDRVQGGEIGIHGNYKNQFGWGLDSTLASTFGHWQILAAYRTNSEDRSGLQLPSSSPAPKLPSYGPDGTTSHGLTLGSNVALLKAGYLLGDKGRVSVTGYFSQIDRGAEFADWAQLSHGLDSSGRSNGTNISLRHGTADIDLSLSPASSLDLQLNCLLFAGGPTSRDRIEIGSDTYYVKRDFGYRGLDSGIEAHWRPTKSLSVLMAAGLIVDHVDLPVISDVPKVTGGELRVRSMTSSGVYLTNKAANGLVVWTPLPQVTVAGGLRYDHHRIYGGQPSARLDGLLAIRPNLHLKLLYGSAFKAPSPQLLFGSPLSIGDISGNASLKATHVHALEFQISYRPSHYAFLTTGVAYSYVLDQAEFSQQGLNQVALNISHVTSISWESEFKLDYRRKIAVYANLALNSTRRRLKEEGYAATLTNYRNIAYPTAVANAGISALIPRLPLRLSAEATVVSARPSSATNALEHGGRYELAPYSLFGASLRTVGLRWLRRETMFMLVGRNLADSRIADPGFGGIDYPQNRRTVMLQMVQEF